MKTPLSRKIGQNICNLRSKRDWSQEELAEKVKVDDSTVQRWECGCAVPCGFDVLKLAVALEVRTDDLYEGLPRSVDELSRMHPRKCMEHSEAA